MLPGNSTYTTIERAMHQTMPSVPIRRSCRPDQAASAAKNGTNLSVG